MRRRISGVGSRRGTLVASIRGIGRRDRHPNSFAAGRRDRR